MPIWSPAFFGSGAGSSGYVIEDSIWLDGSADYLSWTPSATASSNTDKTISFWIKRVKFGSVQWVLDVASNGDQIQYTSGDKLEISLNATTDSHYTTKSVYRDPTAWTHIVIAFDTDSGTAANKKRLWINGVLQEDAVLDNHDDPADDANVDWMKASIAHNLGRRGNDSQFLAGYLAEFIGIDGTAYEASGFGEYDDNGVWVPVNPSGLTYGNNGFLLQFKQTGSGQDANGIGADTSGKDNHWAVGGGAIQTNQVTDTPTDDADNNIGNHATWNPLATAGGSTYTNGNTTFRGDSTADDVAKGTIAVSSGKYYWRIYLDAVQADGYPQVGIQQINKVTTLSGGFAGSDDFTWVIFCQGSGTASPGGQGRHNSSETSQILSSIAATDYIDHALDMDAGKLWWGRNGTFSGDPAAGSGEAYSGITGTVYPFANTYTSSNATIDITGGTAPSGYGRLSAANLPAPTVADPSKYFATVTYTGDTNNNRDITGFQDAAGDNVTPDWVWIKGRSNATSHYLQDVVRGFGASKELMTDGTNAEGSQGTGNGYIGGVVAGGFTAVDGSSNDVYVNENGRTYVAWMWKAGGSASSNSNGDITSSVSVADHGGFSIVKYDPGGSGSPGDTVGHGLSRAPNFIILKVLESVGDQNWSVGSDDIGWTNNLFLNRTDAKSAGSGPWNNTAPTSSVFSIGSDRDNDAAYIAYCFARTPGLIGIGSYIGNGVADGPYVVVDDGASGFLPAFVMFKNINAGQSWEIHDLGREPYNITPEGTFAGRLQPDTSSAESTTFILQKHANGFRIVTGGASTNGSGNTFVYIAFAENPFGGDGVAQAKAL